MKIRFHEGRGCEHGNHGCFVITDKDRDSLIGWIHGPTCPHTPFGCWIVRSLDQLPRRVVAKCHTLEEAKQEAIAYWF